MRAEYRLPTRQGATVYAGAEEIIHSANAGPFLEANPESPSFDTTAFPEPATKLLNLHWGVMYEGLDLEYPSSMPSIHNHCCNATRTRPAPLCSTHTRLGRELWPSRARGDSSK